MASAAEIATWNGERLADPATLPMPRSSEGQDVAKVSVIGRQPSQWAVDAKHAGTPLTLIVGIGFLIYTFGGWFGPSVWVPWQTKFLGSEKAQENIIKATAVLLETTEQKASLIESMAKSNKQTVETLERIERRLDAVLLKGN